MFVYSLAAVSGHGFEYFLWEFFLFSSSSSVIRWNLWAIHYKFNNSHHQHHYHSIRFYCQHTDLFRHFWLSPSTNSFQSITCDFSIVRCICRPDGPTRLYHLSAYGKSASFSSLFCKTYPQFCILCMFRYFFHDSNRCELRALCGCSSKCKVQCDVFNETGSKICFGDMEGKYILDCSGTG